MNRQKPDTGIGWTDWTWNPVRGCRGVHSWCYARDWARRYGRSFEPSFHPAKLSEPAKVEVPARIFVCSMGDLWGPWVPVAWQEAVLAAAAKAPWHTYQFLTHYPQQMGLRMAQLATLCNEVPKRWVGASAHHSHDAAAAAATLFRLPAPVCFVSVEPIFSRVFRGWSLAELDWLIIGALTGNIRPAAYRKVAPEQVGEWALELATVAQGAGQPVFLKRNLYTEGCLDRDVVEAMREFPRPEKGGDGG